MQATSSVSTASTSSNAGIPLSDILRDPRRREKPGKAEQALIVRNLWQFGLDQSRDLRVRQWVRNLVITYGDSEVMWSRRADRLLSVPQGRLRRYRTPLLPGRVSYFAARMVQSAPEWTAIPASDSIEDEEASKFCEKLLRFAYREQRVDLARYFAVIQMCLFGFGLIESYVDDEAEVVLEYETKLDDYGQPMMDHETGQPVYETDARGRPRIAEATTRPGVKVRPVSPFSFVMPPGMEWPLLQDAPYVIRAKWLTESYIRRRYEVSDDVTLSNNAGGNYEALASYLQQVTSPSAVSTERFEKGRLLVLEYYEPARDVKGYYEGKVLTVCGNELIGDERSLFDDGHYPFFMFPWMPVTDSPYGFPWLNPQVDPQSRMNQTITHLMDHTARVGSPNVIADRASGIPDKATFNYQVYFMTPGARRPEFMQAPAMPTGAYEMYMQAQRDMDQAGMSYPLARGESQKGITSGYHARVIQDADQTEMGPVVQMHAAEFSRLGESILDLYRDYGGDDKMLSIVGQDGKCEMFAFKKADIPFRQRVFVQEDSLLIHYRSALEERAISLGNAGAFGSLQNDPEARKMFMGAIRDPKMSGPLTPEAATKAMLDALHYTIIHEGKQPQIEPWWNLDAHRAAAHDRLVRERRLWDDETYKRFMVYWANLEDAAQHVAEQAKRAALGDAKLQMDMQSEMMAREGVQKAKLEVLRQTGHLAVESMKTDGAAGAGAGVAAISGTSPEDMTDESGDSNAKEKTGE